MTDVVVGGGGGSGGDDGDDGAGGVTFGSIEPIEIQEEMERSFLDYAMSVIVSRPCPTPATASSPCTGGSSTTCSSRATGPTGPS